MAIKFDDEYEVFYHANGQDESYFIQSSKGLNVSDDFEIKSVRKIIK